MRREIAAMRDFKNLGLSMPSDLAARVDEWID
jgi:hypothetical protein